MATESGFKASSENSPFTSDLNLSDSSKKKPCEICGSFANELLIMTCFKCRETREHIYCAKVMLRRVPRMWLCEDCRNSSSIVEIVDKTAHPQVEIAVESIETAQASRSNQMEIVVDYEDSIDQTDPSSRTNQVFHNRDSMNNKDSIEATPSSRTNQVVDNKDSTETDPSSRTKQVKHQYTTSEESSFDLPIRYLHVHH